MEIPEEYKAEVDRRISQGIATREETLRPQIDGLNRKVTELTARLESVAEPDTLLRDLEKRTERAELEASIIERCHEVGLDRRLLDGFSFGNLDEASAKILQLSTATAVSSDERLQRSLASGDKPGAGNTDSAVEPDYSKMSSEQLRAAHIVDQTRLLNNKFRAAY